MLRSLRCSLRRNRGFGFESRNHGSTRQSLRRFSVPRLPEIWSCRQFDRGSKRRTRRLLRRLPRSSTDRRALRVGGYRQSFRTVILCSVWRRFQPLSNFPIATSFKRRPGRTARRNVDNEPSGMRVSRPVREQCTLVLASDESTGSGDRRRP